MASEVIERSLYNGRYNLVHNPNARGRAPRYLVNGTEKPKGVTTILGQTLAKDLIDWAISCSIDYLRTKLPVVTEEDLRVASKAYTVKRDSGANTGTEAHILVEDQLKGREVKLEGASQEAENAFSAFMDWYTNVPIKVINVEEVIYSAEYKFAGTYDCMLEVEGKVYLCDLKTTNTSRKAPKGVYAENFIQLGAYAMAHEEQRVFELANGGTKLVEIEDLMVISAKKNGELDIVTASDMGLTVVECGEMMKRVVNIHQFLDYTTKKLSDK